ncbi:MAG TPA: hypothetical protein VNN79_08830, partial [Actinomycetota bacterium]|nr:hypothetical protein [Actinomycetota bacterium]
MSRGAMGRGVLTAVAATLAVTAVAGGATTASAAWTASGSGASRSAATSVNAGQTPSGVVTGRDVAVSWLASTLASGAAVDGYVVRRYTTAGVVQTVNASCTGVVPGLACTEKGVPSGTWKYTVQPRSGDNWTGAESGFSANVAVGSPTISITSPTTVNTLPATLNGTMANFVDGEVLTFHLDSVGGTTLAGTVGGTATPAAVPTGGSAAVTVTIPTGTPDGSHTIVAVAAPSGDSASAGITVSTPSPT